ncbi:MAG: hypothetical protein KJ002_00820 [Candidatus Dadabacteria bacterium]|nr:hypothetical protein [Candidatus Dadabacteria bacterium]
MTVTFKKFLLYAVFTLGLLPLGAGHSSAFSGAIDGTGRALVQLDPETEQLDQVSEPIGELSEPVEGVPTEPLDAVSESDDAASEEIGQDIAPTEELDQVSETDDQASEEVGADSETAAEASEVLPSAPEGEEYGLEEEAPEGQMPLGDREAEGRGLGY